MNAFIPLVLSSLAEPRDAEHHGDSSTTPEPRVGPIGTLHDHAGSRGSAAVELFEDLPGTGRAGAQPNGSPSPVDRMSRSGPASGPVVARGRG